MLLKKLKMLNDLNIFWQNDYVSDKRNFNSNESMTATATAANTHGTHNKRISAQTVHNCLREGGLCAHYPYVARVLARHHRVNRVNWADTYQCWLRQQWNSFLFFDESRFTIHRGDGRVQVYRRRNEHFADCCVHEQDPFGGRGFCLGLGQHCTWFSP